MPAPPHHSPSEQPRDPAESPRPQVLRLSAILIELGAQAHPLESPEAQAASPAAGHERSNLTLGQIVDRTAHAGFGFLVALLALVAIPFVGLSTPFGLAIAFVGAQMAVGSSRPWLPQRLRRHLVAMTTLDWISRRLARWTGGLERWVKPRWTLLTRGPFWTAIGAGIILLGLGLALPLPIPGSNWIFLLPILLYAIGLLEDDGLLVLLGHLGAIVDMVLCVLFYDAVMLTIVRSLHWFAAAS